MVIRPEDITASICAIGLISWLWAFEYREKSSMVKFLIQVGVSHVFSAILVAATLLLVVPFLFGVTWTDVTIPPEQKKTGPVLFGLLLAPFIAMLYGFRLRRKAARAGDAADFSISVDKGTERSIGSDKDHGGRGHNS